MKLSLKIKTLCSYWKLWTFLAVAVVTTVILCTVPEWEFWIVDYETADSIIKVNTSLVKPLKPTKETIKLPSKADPNNRRQDKSIGDVPVEQVVEQHNDTKTTRMTDDVRNLKGSDSPDLFVAKNKFCPRGWFSQGDWDCYWPSQYMLSFVDATKQCNKREATLLMLFSEDEYNNLVELMKSTGLMRRTWIRADKYVWSKIKRTINHNALNMTINGIVYDYRVYLGKYFKHDL